MVAKKASEAIFTKKTVGELVVGDRFREIQDPDKVTTDIPLQEVISIDKSESPLLEEDQVTRKQIVVCETKVEGFFEKFRFTAFTKVEVEVLNG